MKKLLIGMILLSNPQIYAQEWVNDLDVAFKEAEADNKRVLLYFSVPDACDICKQLEENVLQSDEFQAYAKANFVLAQPDFRESLSMAEKAENLLIVEKYNKDGFFPLVVVLDKNAKVLGKTGIYNNETPRQYLTLLESFGKKKT